MDYIVTTPEPKPKFLTRVKRALVKTWNFLDGHKTKIGTVVYFANEYLGNSLPDQVQVGLNIASQLMVALGLVHGVTKVSPKTKIINKLKKK